ncbi:hypothetical protein D7Y13_27825 [Corallococcus praedator]|uniref:Type II toxin-antitoxin system RelE/ParE family toxin n=1 Tax=Corallococcus praedator TaxID=2316724 RepID=A0ABX9QC22_9BACT|nr:MULTISPECIES: hypothetical protein [Corallococcus]RKH14225.1 hypothetical protein D7X74_20460 [Corallococcus sp. CA047B]RKH23746.1 hypothetical protein D7X75_33180 [Corallococcus sp. CA031C]RKH99215.1 hypothetical protein D7Y13_27825 [Corallococcus praedator]
MHTVGAAMAYRFQLEPQVVRALCACPTEVREQLQEELGALASLMPGTPVPLPAREGAALLTCGFQVRYRLEPGEGLLRLTTLQPLRVVPPPAS